ncbi:MAG: BCD family MFS transporter [Myxococcota bacterium]
MTQTNAAPRTQGGPAPFGWFSIFRLGLVQTALGAVVVLTTSTLNRVMVVELGLAAMVPGALVTLHHAMQMLRPRMGYGSDLGRRRTPWIVGGMAALALGGFLAALATTMMDATMGAGLALAIVAYALIGGGVSACGTSLLVLMAKRVAEGRRAAAATMVWMMMIAGFAITATIAGKLLDPFSGSRLVAVAGGVCALAFATALVAMWRLEGRASASMERSAGEAVVADEPEATKPPFRQALKQVWAEPDARRFTVFVFVSMLAYSAQDLILEPFAGAVFDFTPGASTQLSGTQHGGIFAGMLVVAVVTSLFKGTAVASPRAWVVGGCLASFVAMSGLVVAGLTGGPWPLVENVCVLGVANGVFSIAAIAAMMTLAGHGRDGREGTRMGLWGAAQAIAFGAGGFLGTVLVDAARAIVGPTGGAYAFVFGLEALGFFVAHLIALRTSFERREPGPESRVSPATAGAQLQPEPL